jgi:hypothetical protein
LREEFLNEEIFYSMKKLRALAERRRDHCNKKGHIPRWSTEHRFRLHGRPAPHFEMMEFPSL